MDVPAVDTPMGVLSLDEVFVRYDGPRLFTCRNESGQTFLVVFADETEDTEAFLYAPVSPFRWAAVRSGQLPLRRVFERPLDNHVFLVRSNIKTGETTCQRLLSSQISTEWLPSESARLQLPTTTKHAFTSDELGRRAASAERSHAAFELDAGSLRTEYPLRSLGLVMVALQDVLETVGQVVRNERINRGAVSSGIMTEAALDFVDVEAASFVLIVAPATSGQLQLFESPLVRESVRYMMDLMAIGDEPDRLREALTKMHSRAVSKYRNLLEEIAETESSLTAFLARPHEAVERIELTKRGVRTSLAVLQTANSAESATPAK